MNPLLQAEKLKKSVSFGRERLLILDDVSLSLNEGESLAVTGVSGSGKTTLLSLVAGLDIPDSGSVRIAGRELTELDEEQRARLRGELAGVIFQSFHLLPGLTALENVMLPLELHGLAKARGRARDILAKVGLEARCAHYPRQLSGGEQQRVAIARAYVMEPKLLLADEPTGNLDTQTARRVADLLFELSVEQGSALFLVTHDSAMAKRCTQEIKLLDGSPAA